jgi:hypothetical protein
MKYTTDLRRTVRYELMLGREATAAMAQCPVGYLPVGCLERHNALAAAPSQTTNSRPSADS